MRIATSLLLLLAVAGCASLRPGGGASSNPAASSGAVAVSGSVTAGPSCPVVTEPPQSRCAERPVAGAVILVQDADGRQVARLVSQSDGTISASLPPGHYRIVPQPVQGLMGTAPAERLTIHAGDPVDDLAIIYDTGIR